MTPEEQKVKDFLNKERADADRNRARGWRLIKSEDRNGIAFPEVWMRDDNGELAYYQDEIEKYHGNNL